MNLNKGKAFKIYQSDFIFLLHSSVFTLVKKTWKMVNFWIYLPLKLTLVATFNKACTLTSRKYVVEQCMNVPVHQKHLHFFRCKAPFSLQKNSLKMLNFQFFLLRKQFLVATLSKPCPLISRRYLAEQGIVALLRFLI